MKVLMSLGLVCFGSSGLGQFASSVYNIDQNNFKKCFCGKATVIIHHSKFDRWCFPVLDTK